MLRARRTRITIIIITPKMHVMTPKAVTPGSDVYETFELDEGYASDAAIVVESDINY